MRSERWAVMLLLSAGSIGLDTAHVKTPKGYSPLALGSRQPYAHKSHTSNHKLLLAYNYTPPTHTHTYINTNKSCKTHTLTYHIQEMYSGCMTHIFTKQICVGSHEQKHTHMHTDTHTHRHSLMQTEKGMELEISERTNSLGELPRIIGWYSQCCEQWKYSL